MAFDAVRLALVDEEADVRAFVVEEAGLEAGRGR